MSHIRRVSVPPHTTASSHTQKATRSQRGATSTHKTSKTGKTAKAKESDSPLIKELKETAKQSRAKSAEKESNSLTQVLELVSNLLSTLVELVASMMKGGATQPDQGAATGGTGDAGTTGVPAGGSDVGTGVSTPGTGVGNGTTTTPQNPGNTTNTPKIGTQPGSEVDETADVSGGQLEAIQSDTGEINVRTADGYQVRFEGKNMEWVITGPDGKSTRIWGDPHVYESDGDKWDFLNRGTFEFGENKATVEVVPFGNGQTVSARVTIYSGDERVTISGIDQNKPVISAVANDGRQHDDALDDGDVYRRELTATGEEWMNADAKAMA